MRYRARCPMCDYRLPRVEAFSWSVRTACPTCDAPLRQNLVWAWAYSVSLLFPFTTFAVLGAVGALRHQLVLVFFAMFLLLAFGMFPYVIRYTYDPRVGGAPKRRRRRRWVFRSFLWRMVRRFWVERLTRPGRYVLLGATVTLMAGSLPAHMAGAYAFCFFVVLFALSLACSVFLRPRLSVRRVPIRRCMAGSTTRMIVEVINTGRRRACDIGAYEYRLPRGLKLDREIQYVPTLEPGQTHRFEYELAAERRGSYPLTGPTGLSAFPFGLTHARRFVPQHEALVVYPAFVPLSRFDLPSGLRYQPGGLVVAARVGDSMEFVGNREYQVGDRIRDIHPRSWARVGQPIVKQHDEEFLTRVAMVVDTYAPSSVRSQRLPGRGRARRIAPLEANLSLAAAIADFLARQEYMVDLFAAGPDLYQFHAGSRVGYLDPILDVLACLDRSDVDPLEAIGPEFRQQLRQTSTVVVLLLVWNQRREAFVRSIEQAGAAVKPILVTGDSEQRAAAEAAGVQVVSPAEVVGGVESL